MTGAAAGKAFIGFMYKYALAHVLISMGGPYEHYAAPIMIVLGITWCVVLMHRKYFRMQAAVAAMSERLDQAGAARAPSGKPAPDAAVLTRLEAIEAQLRARLGA
ncbi:hypothetical protein E3E11_06680 [Oecophyllibacter saccharovorans]|uniref:hypothetical protein n=1 Tax=Oecophyllibacter saccharovorans TaxID=2558360 RepID=UPI00114438E5|nr:hypothetical protein [Oecophyllibacter saccharovorans]QDH15590.1 hypothetical protein E3E11_06680 [Oecophyllibacter saccharovorans]